MDLCVYEEKKLQVCVTLNATTHDTLNTDVDVAARMKRQMLNNSCAFFMFLDI